MNTNESPNSHPLWGNVPSDVVEAYDAGLELAPGGARLVAAYYRAQRDLLEARQRLLEAALWSAVEHEILVPVNKCPDTVAELLAAPESDSWEFRYNPQSGGPE